MGKTSGSAPVIFSGTTNTLLALRTWRDQKNSTAGVHGETEMSVEQHVALQRLQERSWFMGGKASVKPQPLFGCYQLLSLCLPAESRSGELHLQKAIAGAEPLELNCWSCCAFRSVGLHQSQQADSAQSKGIPRPDSEELLARCAISDQGQFSSSKAHGSHEGQSPSCSRSSPSPEIHPGF